MVENLDLSEQEENDQSDSNNGNNNNGNGNKGCAENKIGTHFQSEWAKELQKLLDKEICGLLENERSQALKLLGEGFRAEMKFIQDWGTPLEWSTDGCNDEALHKAECWLEEQQLALEIDKRKAQGDPQVPPEDQPDTIIGKQKAIDDHKANTIAPLEQGLTDLIARLKAFPDEKKAVEDLIAQLVESWAKTPDGLLKTMIDGEISNAQARYDVLCSNGNELVTRLKNATNGVPPENLKDAIADALKKAREELACDTQYKDDLNQAIQETLDQWRVARDTLRELVATGENSLESLNIDVKQINKQLEYLKTYKDLLIAEYLMQNNLCDES